MIIDFTKQEIVDILEIVYPELRVGLEDIKIAEKDNESEEILSEAYKYRDELTSIVNKLRAAISDE